MVGMKKPAIEAGFEGVCGYQRTAANNEMVRRGVQLGSYQHDNSPLYELRATDIPTELPSAATAASPSVARGQNFALLRRRSGLHLSSNALEPHRHRTRFPRLAKYGAFPTRLHVSSWSDPANDSSVSR